MNNEDIVRLEHLADRLSKALYYEKLEGLQHDDYDLLRRVAKEEKITNLKAELAKLEARP